MKTATATQDRGAQTRLIASVSEVVFTFPSGNTLLNVVGEDGAIFPALVPTGSARTGEVVEMQGYFTGNQPPGRCFTAKLVATHEPARLDRDAATLCEALQVTAAEAKLLIAQFGSDVFKILEHRPEDLAAVTGFDAKSGKYYGDKWKAHRAASLGDQLLRRIEPRQRDFEALKAAIKRHHQDLTQADVAHIAAALTAALAAQ